MNTATLIEPVAEDSPVAPTADELKTVYDILDRLFDAIMTVAETCDLDDSAEALAGMERDLLLAARSVVHRHMLVTLYPAQHIGHYRVHVTEGERP